MSVHIVDLREKSRKSISVKKNADQFVTHEEVQVGCLLRIADSMELMAKDRIELERQNKFLNQLASDRAKEIETLKKAVASYKGKFRKANSLLREMEAKCI
ncbi:hypothetical protein [Pedobacter zeae]|uniref:Uncharacterized protein n=1 Tax=Pedobacter zeae TaxID=1737356 RepID=A0A7W6P669_9SPHI|nr:hypothetical protein [Pedobacter zeae]MBB4107706.1 hypothetical protein [Pedobacter zeae]GGG97604.1 hypothetical protein GCM10007422_09460 [Pedobacter zeae]